MTIKQLEAELQVLRSELQQVTQDLQVAQAKLVALREDVAKGLEFGGDQLRPLFGQGQVALTLDAIAKGLRRG
jgi:hypothetical protein